MAATNAKKIIVTVGTSDITFNVGLADYERYQNEFMPNNKVAPSKNFLNRTVADDCKEALAPLLEQGLATELAGTLVGEYRPKLEITVKE